jgi:hypothetical protein
MLDKENGDTKNVNSKILTIPIACGVTYYLSKKIQQEQFNMEFSFSNWIISKFGLWLLKESPPRRV